MNVYGQSDIVGVPAMVREGVSAAARANHISDRHVIAKLERTYRNRVNEILSGTGLALVGDKVIGPDTFTPDQVWAQVRLEEASRTPSASTAALAGAGLGRPDNERAASVQARNPMPTVHLAGGIG
ncbi:hypothetical protein [Ruania zhangjianzhongii]|uniref:hypothetical protein n=1 Tax=Ruania zhangjianzhongii TaxID=2603206 RepID=UPI0011D21559|nr:hypothetical protein [Ruania zhangjianzhongii]